MQTPQFKESYQKLNPAQKQAVDSIEGPVMVVAGPGTGKTQVLTLRIANILLKTQTSPENILALTFSESASHQMRQRLLKVIGPPAYKVEISTFHSFANSIIQDFPEEFQNLISAESILEDEQIQYIEKIIETTDLSLLRPWGDQFFYVRDILSSISDLKKEGITPDKLAAGLNRQKADLDVVKDLYHEKGPHKGKMKSVYAQELKNIAKIEEFIKVYTAYTEILTKNKKYDFNDMLIESVKVLESNPQLLLLYQEKYHYILVDEHQDTNASQNRLVELLASFHEVPNLFVVGDEKQAIYRFQGASLENFLYFQKRYPQANLINLNLNYRSHQTILDASISFISKNISANILTEQIKLIASANIKSQNIKVAQLNDYFGEFKFVADSIQKLIENGVNPSEIAVLGRRNQELSDLSNFLKQKKINYCLDADLDVLSDLWIRKFLLILESVSDFASEEKFAKILNIDILGNDPFNVFHLIQQARKEHQSIFELLESNDSRFEKINSFYKIYKGWVTLSKNIQLDDLFIKILNESGIRQGFLSLPDRNEILAKFITLFESIKEKIYKLPDYSLSDFLYKLELVRKHKLSIKAKSNISLKEGVRLFTVHKAKGLEFEYVFILQCIAGRWGSLRKRSEKIKLPWNYLGEKVKTAVEFEEIEDERRLFFVGLTRAKKDVILSYSNLSEEGKEQLPSQFITEIDSNLRDSLDTSDFNFDFSQNKDILFDEIIPEIDLENEHQFLRKIFLEKGLNVSAVDNFLTCPWKYFFVNLISIPAVRNKYQLFGTAIHSSLESLIKKRKIEKNPKQHLLKSLEWYLSLQGLTDKDYQEYLAKGRLALNGFYDNTFINFPDSIQSELNVRGVKISDRLTLNGRIDMLEEESGKFIVHDFKTGKPKSRTDINGSKPESNSNYLRQLVFYKILLDEYKNGLMNADTGVIDFVEPDDKGRFKSEVFILEDKDKQSLLQQLNVIADQIYNFTFWNDTCGEKDCQWCELRKMMG